MLIQSATKLDSSQMVCLYKLTVCTTYMFHFNFCWSFGQKIYFIQYKAAVSFLQVVYHFNLSHSHFRINTSSETSSNKAGLQRPSVEAVFSKSIHKMLLAEITTGHPNTQQPTQSQIIRILSEFAVRSMIR